MVSERQEIQNFLLQWKSSNFSGGSSIIIALNTLKEVDDYRNGSGLDRADYAVISSNPEFNSYGLGRERAGEARIVFTTHEQFNRQVRKAGSFEAANLFHYHGIPRSLLIWDEGLHLTPCAAINYNELRALPAAIGRGNADLVDAFERIIPDKGNLKAGDTMAIPADMREWADKALQVCGQLREDTKRVFEAIGKLAGGRVRYKWYKDGWYLLGTGMPLPADMPPTIVLDASGRLTDRYDRWAAQGLPVVQFEPVASDYANLSIKWIDRGAGNTSMANPETRHQTYRMIANIINAKPDEAWAIVLRKVLTAGEREGCLPGELVEMLDPKVDPVAITWGRHIGTNDYRHIRKMIVLGAHEYNGAAYDAIHLAKGGTIDIDALPKKAAQDMEYMHHMFQAVCRSNVRNHVDGVCGEAEVHFIMPTSGGRVELMRRTFPGADIEIVMPEGIKPRNKAEQVIAAFEALFKRQTIVTYDDLRNACGVPGKKKWLSNPLGSQLVQDWLKRNGVRKVGTTFIRSQLLS